MKTTALKKRLSDFKLVMKTLEDHLKTSNRWVRNPNEVQINEMYDFSFPILGITNSTPTGRVRRLEQLSWITAVTLIR